MTTHQRNLSAGGTWEPSCLMTVLKACPKCGTPHPLASNPPVHTDKCPGCGGDVSTPEYQEAKAQGNIWLAIANGFQWIANALFRLSQRF